MSGRLEGKVALVTGAGSSGPGVGIGKAISVTLAREGASVALVDKFPERAEETLRLVEAAGGAGHVVAADITRPDLCEAMVRTAVDRFGGLDILVNNAAISVHASILETSVELYEDVIGVNLTGSFMACKFAIPALAARGGGSIVNIGSMASIRDIGSPHPAYCASKAALLGLAVDLAGAHGLDNIRVNTVLPGQIDTPMARTVIAGRPSMQAGSPLRNLLGRKGDAWDIANAVLFLCGDEAAFITGVTLPVDGGSIVATPGSYVARAESVI